MKLELAFINRESETSIKEIRNLLSNKIKMLSDNKFSYKNESYRYSLRKSDNDINVFLSITPLNTMETDENANSLDSLKNDIIKGKHRGKYYIIIVYDGSSEYYCCELSKKLKNDEFIKEKILKSFKSIGKNSIEDFLHNKAIDFEKSFISATHIIFNEKGSEVLGYFTFANKSLIIEKENFLSLSKTQQKRFSQSGRKLKDGSYVVNSFLLAQIGKNYNISDKNMITGNEIISLAHELLLIVKKIINTKYLWLECEDNSSLIRFYSNYGFNLIKKFSSENNLKTMILRLDNF